MKCSAVNSNQNDLRRKTSEAEEGLIGLRDRAERAEEEVVRLQEKLTTEGGVAQVTMELSDKREAEVARLKKEAEVREEEAKEVQAKLSKVGFLVQACND